MGKCLFSPELKSYLITQWNCTTIGSCRCRKTNQWVGSGAARAYGDDTRQYSRRNGWGIWLYKRSFCHRILRFFLLQRRRLRLHWSREAYSLLTCLAVGPSDLDLLGWSAFNVPQHRSSSGPVHCRYPAIISHKFTKRANRRSNAAPLLRLVQVSPAHRWRSQRVCFLPGEIPCGCRARWFWLFSLREYQSRLSAHAHRFLFREWSRPSRPPVFFLPGTCEEKTAGQRFSAPGWKRAHAGSDPACLAFATQRDVSRPFYPTWPASLCKRERSGLVWGKWRWAGRWQHVTGSFRCWGAVDLSDWPRPLRFARAQRRQSRDGCRTFPCPLKSGWRAGFGVVSTRGALSQPSGWVVSAGAPSGPSTTTVEKCDGKTAHRWGIWLLSERERSSDPHH